MASRRRCLARMSSSANPGVTTMSSFEQLAGSAAGSSVTGGGEDAAFPPRLPPRGRARACAECGRISSAYLDIESELLLNPL